MLAPYRGSVPSPSPKDVSSEELAKFARALETARRRDVLVGLAKRIVLGVLILASNALVLVLVFELGVPPVVASVVFGAVWVAAWALLWSRRRA